MDYLWKSLPRPKRQYIQWNYFKHLLFLFHNIFTTSHANFSAKNAEVNDDAIKALITWWQQIDFKADYINSWAKGEADIMEINPLNILKIP